MANINYYKMNEIHVKGVVAVEEACFSIPWSKESFIEELTKNPFARYFIAVCDRDIVAYGGMHFIIDEAQVMNIAVLPDFRRLHIGNELLKIMVEDAKKSGMTYMTLEVRSQNEAAIRLYEKHGFSQNGLRKGYYKDPSDDAALMQYIF